MPNEDRWYISGPLGIGETEPYAPLVVSGEISLKSPDSGIHSLRFKRTDEDNRVHEWALWHMNQKFRKNALEIWEYKTDSTGKTCDGNPADGAMCFFRLGISEGGNVGIGTPEPKATFDVNGSTLLGYETTLTQIGLPAADFGAPLKSGFYQNGGAKLTGDVPDTSHSWTHLITARHSNTSNNHQLQIAASYRENDKLYFRKIAADGASNPTWNEVATRGSNQFIDKQGISGSNTLEFGADVAGKEVNAGKIGYGTFDPGALCVVGAGTSGSDRKITMWAEGGLTVHGNLQISKGEIQAQKISINGSAWVNGALFLSSMKALSHVTKTETHIDGETGEREEITVNYLVLNGDKAWSKVTVNGTVETVSSKLFKQDICKLSSQSARDVISRLDPVWFTYKEDPAKLKCLGFIAEDSPPEVSAPGSNAIVMNHVIAALTKVVKDQIQSISELQAQIALLTSKATVGGTS